MIGVARSGQRPYDHQATGGQLEQAVAYEMAQTPLHTVADDRATHRFAYDETRTRRGSVLPGRVRVRSTAVQMDDEKRAPGPASPPYRGREVLAPPQPILGRQHVMTCVSAGDQADRRARPLLRRVARIARPARVRIRSRNPWVLARRRLFGWKVRLLTRGLQKKMCGRRDIAWLSPCAHEKFEKLAITPECTASQPQIVIFAHRRQAAAAIDNSTWSRYARLRHPVKPAPHRPPLCTGCGQQLEPRAPA